MNKLVTDAYADVGELGWSLYLAGYLRWKQRNNQEASFVWTYPDRLPLFKDLVTTAYVVPEIFYEKYGDYPQDGFGLYGVPSTALKSFFNTRHEGFSLASEMDFRCSRFFEGKTNYSPYPVSAEFAKKMQSVAMPTMRILVFPRHRKSEHHAKRNLSRKFYQKLIVYLCEKFPEFKITAMGSMNGAYKFAELERFSNFENLVGRTSSIQALIDLCCTSIAAVGGTSAPPKISMLQGVPTYVIGHERERFTVEDNWMNTNVQFWEILEHEYSVFDSQICIEEIAQFIKDVK